jgi:class 3 adenylate cyclase/tetratricopeptide (TPR) repeat protein
MDFYGIVRQVLEQLQRDGRTTYRALKRQFTLDDDALEDLKEELFFAHPVSDENGRGILWKGETEGTPVAASQPAQTSQQPPAQQPQSTQVESLPEPPTPDAERRQLTVMFCDLADSTRLSGQLDPEDLRDVIRAYQSTSAEVIKRYDGYIAQHLGDGLMVYFGWPQAHEDDAQRAIHAGLGILEAMGQLNERLEHDKGIRLVVRIGIHTGLVVVGEIGAGDRQEQLALGETPNIASRLEGLAAPDTVAIGGATFQLVEGYFTSQDLGEHNLKGVAEPIRLYRVLGESGTQSRLDIVRAHGLTPLAGREQEVGLLLERWQQAKDGQGQVVLLTGEAGIGKSRLLQVMKDHVAGEAHTLFECRSSPYYQNTAWYPITDMLLRALNWNQDDTPEAKLDKLEQTLHEYRLELDEAMPLFANLLSLPLPEDCYPPLNISPQQQRQKTLETIMAMLLQQAEQQPILFILEDLHWTDPSTLELLELLIDQTPTAAICVLLTYRPTFQRTWSSRSYLTQVTLNRLSRPQIEQVAEGVAGGKRLPAEVMQQIVEKTDGVPLYVEELTKAVLELETLQEVDGHYELAGALSSIAIPATLQDSLMARLDRLVTARGVAQYAAVMGRQFSYELLHAVSQLNERTLQDELHRLVEAELVYQRGLPPQATYTFKHALITDVAYQSLLKSTRQQYHQRIAQVLEEHFPETVENQPELLAHHYTEAGQNERAVSYWQRAGEQASTRSAYVEALAQLHKGLDLLQRLHTSAGRDRQELALRLMLAESLTVVEGYSTPTLEPIYQRAREIGRQLDDIPQLVTILQSMRRYYVMRLDLEMARQLGVELLALAQRQDDPGALQEGHWGLGQTLYFLGDMAGARSNLEQSSAAYVSQPLTTQASRELAGTQIACLVTLGRPTWALGYPDQSRAYTRQGLFLAQQLAHPYTLAFAHYATALNFFFRREADDVLKQIDASLALGREHDFPVWIAWGAFLRGWSLAMQGQIVEGLSEIHEVWDSYQEMIDDSTRPTAFVILAELYALTNRASEGLQAMVELLALVEKTGGRFWEAEIYRLKGELHLVSNEPQQKTAEAEVCFHQALGVARRQHAKSWELRAATSLARLWQQQGKRQAAYDLLTPVYGWFTEGFDTADLKDARALLDELEG